MFYTVVRGRRLTFARSIDLKIFEIKDLKVRATELKKRKGKEVDLGNPKFVESDTLDDMRVSLVS